MFQSSSTSSTTTANPNKLMVNFKGLGNTPSSSGNTQKAYALYVGGQLKYILPYNGPLGAMSGSQQQNNEMKKLICRGVNGKTEIALAKPTVVCDDEKKKIVFVVQKKATTSPGTSLLSNTKQTTENKTVKIPSLATLTTTSGQSLKGNQIISDNMLKLLLPAVSASINSNSPVSLPSPNSDSGQGQKAKTTPQPSVQNQPVPVEKVPSSYSIPIVVKVQNNVSQSMSTATTTITTTTTTTTSSIPTPTTTTPMTNLKPQVSPGSSSSNNLDSVRPVQLFTRDSARKLCPALPVPTPGNKPCMTILDPTDPEANIRPGKSLLGNSESSQNASKQSAYQGVTPSDPNEILVKKTSGDGSMILQLKGNTQVLSASDKDAKLPEQNSSYTNDAQLRVNPQTVIQVSIADTNKTETMPAVVTASTCEEEVGSTIDEDDGMFGLKISSVFSLAENQPLCSVANEVVSDQDRKLLHNSEPASFQQDQIPADTLATAMKLATSPEETKLNNETSDTDNVDTFSSQRTVIFDLNNVASQSQHDNLQIMLDTSQNKPKRLGKNSITKSSAANIKLEQQMITSFDSDLENVLSGKFSSVDTQTNHSQKENASPKKGASPLIGTEKDLLSGQKYITVDIFRHNGQTKITAVSNSCKKEVTKPTRANSEGASGSSDENKSTPSGSDSRLNEVLQCAAYSLPMGTYFFIPLADKIVAVPSQRRKKNRSAYVFEKNHNFMQVKMAKYVILNSKDKLTTSVVTTMNGSQLVCQINNPSKTKGEPSLVLPMPSALPVKDTIPTLEAPPIVTGKRIRRPKKHTGFEEDMNLIPPLRKCRKKLKPVNKTEKNAKEQTCNDKNSQNVTTNIEGKDIGFGNSNINNKLMLQPVDSKEELASVLRSVDMPVTVSKNNNAVSLPYVYVHPPAVSASKVATPVSSATETSFQDSYHSDLHIDNVQSLQPESIKIKSEPITSGYGDEPPLKVSSPLHTSAPSIVSSVQVGHDALGIPHTIKKEPSWYGYGHDASSPPVLSSINTTSSSHSDHLSTSNGTPSEETCGPCTQPPTLYKMNSPTKSPTGKKRGRKKKDYNDEIKHEVKKRKYVRHKTEPNQTQVPPSALISTLSSFPLKTEVKTEASESTIMGSSSRQNEETPQEERIRRLKEILREKEQKLEEIRHNLSVSTPI